MAQFSDHYAQGILLPLAGTVLALLFASKAELPRTTIVAAALIIAMTLWFCILHTRRRLTAAAGAWAFISFLVAVGCCAWVESRTRFQWIQLLESPLHLGDKYMPNFTPPDPYPSQCYSVTFSLQSMPRQAFIGFRVKDLDPDRASGPVGLFVNQLRMGFLNDAPSVSALQKKDEYTAGETEIELPIELGFLKQGRNEVGICSFGVRDPDRESSPINIDDINIFSIWVRYS